MKRYLFLFVIFLNGCDNQKNINVVKNTIKSEIDSSLTLGMALDNKQDCSSIEWKEDVDSYNRNIVEYTCNLNLTKVQNIMDDYVKSEINKLEKNKFPYNMTYLKNDIDRLVNAQGGKLITARSFLVSKNSQEEYGFNENLKDLVSVEFNLKYLKNLQANLQNISQSEEYKNYESAILYFDENNWKVKLSENCLNRRHYFNQVYMDVAMDYFNGLKQKYIEFNKREDSSDEWFPFNQYHDDFIKNLRISIKNANKDKSKALEFADSIIGVYFKRDLNYSKLFDKDETTIKQKLMSIADQSRNYYSYDDECLKENFASTKTKKGIEIMQVLYDIDSKQFASFIDYRTYLQALDNSYKSIELDDESSIHFNHFISFINKISRDDSLIPKVVSDDIYMPKSGLPRIINPSLNKNYFTSGGIGIPIDFQEYLGFLYMFLGLDQEYGVLYLEAFEDMLKDRIKNLEESKKMMLHDYNTFVEKYDSSINIKQNLLKSNETILKKENLMIRWSILNNEAVFIGCKMILESETGRVIEQELNEIDCLDLEYNNKMNYSILKKLMNDISY